MSGSQDLILPDPARGGSFYCHVSQVRSMESSQSHSPGCFCAVGPWFPNTVTSLLLYRDPPRLPFQATPSTCELARNCSGGLVFVCNLKKPTCTTPGCEKLVEQHMKDPIAHWLEQFLQQFWLVIFYQLSRSGVWLTQMSHFLLSFRGNLRRRCNLPLWIAGQENYNLHMVDVL